MTDIRKGTMSAANYAKLLERHAAAKQRRAHEKAAAAKRAKREARAKLNAHYTDPDVQTYHRELRLSTRRTAPLHAAQMAEAQAAWDRLQAQDEIRTRGGRRRLPCHIRTRDPLEIELLSFRSTTGA